MKVAIVNITGGRISGGYKKYLKTLLSHITSGDDIEQILCASPEQLSVSSWIKPTGKIQFVTCKPYRLFGGEDVELHKQLDLFKPDVIFIPLERYFSHRDIPTVCMLQNMLPLIDFKHVNVLEIIRNKIQKLIAYKAMRRSQRIIALSSFVSDYLQKKWQIPAHKIGLVYHGTDFDHEKEMSVPHNVSSQLSGSFLFTAGSIERYRGLEDIIYAVDRLKKEGKNHIALIAGSTRRAMKSYSEKLKEKVIQMGLEESIYWLGNLNDNEMAWCYRNCFAFIMTSRVESFGQTALEAMSHGCTCISTRNPCLPEIFGDVAAYYNSGDEVALSQHINDMFLSDPLHKKNMSQCALRRAAQFSNDVCVNRTVNEFKKAIASQ